MRTKEDILSDFEFIDYEVREDESSIILERKIITSFILDNTYHIHRISINKRNKDYYARKEVFIKNKIYDYEEKNITMQEHKLLTELFEILGWI